MNLLIVEDDIEISEMLRTFLESEGYSITTAYDGERALKLFNENSFDLILLDLMVPKLSGMAIMKNIRAKSTIPIIIISAKDTDSDKTLGLGLGADDYITKPFSITEVLARIKAHIRRTAWQSSTLSDSSSHILSAADITMNLGNYTVYKKGKKIDLTNKEFEILKLLLEHPDKVYTKAQIYSLIWKEDYFGDENAVNVHISRLRTKIEDDPREPLYIITVWGIGYKLGGI